MSSQERLKLIKAAAQRVSGEGAVASSAHDSDAPVRNPPPRNRRHPNCMPPIVLKRSEPMSRNKALPGWTFWPQRI